MPESAACCCHLSPEEWRRCPIPEHDHTKWTEHGWNCPASCGHPMAMFPDEDCPACIQGCLGCHRKYVRTINGYCAECVERPDEPRWVLDKNSDVWAQRLALTATPGSDSE